MNKTTSYKQSRSHNRMHVASGSQFWACLLYLLHCVLSLATQCIVIGPVCLQWAGGQALYVCDFVGLLPW